MRDLGCKVSLTFLKGADNFVLRKKCLDNRIHSFSKFAMKEKLSDRNIKILQAVLDHYITTAEPVGSRTISKKYWSDLSPATIRNAMADLEDMGFLEQPHTSAGRVPTDMAYRFYVDNLYNIPEPTLKESQTIKKKLETNHKEAMETLLETSRVLSKLSKQAGIILLPKFANITFKRIELVKTRAFQVLVVFISQSGVVQNKLTSLKEDLTQDKLDSIARYLNDKFNNLTLLEVRKKIVSMMNKEKKIYNTMLKKAMELMQKAFIEDEIEGDFYVAGTSTIFDQPEFKDDLEKMKGVFNALEKKSKLLFILDQCLEEQGVSVIIGSENNIHEMRDCSFVIGNYKYGPNVLGTLGIFGPKRMEYPKIISLVDYTVNALSSKLSDF